MTAIRRLLLLAALTTLAAVLPTTSAGAAAPEVTTAPAEAIQPGGARLAGRVDPNGEVTSYAFEYGTTRRFGSRTPDASAGRGTSARRVTTVVSGLRPNTVYFFRLVASNPSGVRSGQTRSFRTKPQPLGLQVAATPNPVIFGGSATVTGTLTGTGNAGRQVQLQQRAFPYTSPFADVGNPQVTSDTGAFAFPLLALAQTSQLRVRTVQGGVVSPVITLGVAVDVGTRVSDKRVKRGRRVRFSGTIRPARPGAQFAVQKRTRDGRWVVVAGGITRGGSTTSSTFSKRVKVTRTARYRIFVSIVDGNLVSGLGREIRVRARR